MYLYNNITPVTDLSKLERQKQKRKIPQIFQMVADFSGMIQGSVPHELTSQSQQSLK